MTLACSCGRDADALMPERNSIKQCERHLEVVVVHDKCDLIWIVNGRRLAQALVMPVTLPEGYEL